MSNRTTTAHPLDDPIGSALRTRHASIATIDGPARLYPTDVAPFASIPFDSSDDDWAALGRLTRGSGEPAVMFVPTGFPISDAWRQEFEIGLTQLTDDHVDVLASKADRGDDIVDLGIGDVPEMLRLTALTKPGPFLPRTVEFGGYVGVFDTTDTGDRTLVAMAGRRLSMPGWVEISAVCTDPEARGRGYARRLIAEVARGVRAEGDRAFLHVAHDNPARSVYERMGFVARADSTVIGVRPAAD